jgi:hypothetical protein
MSSCMYYTGINPFTMKPIEIIRDYHTKKKMKKAMLNLIGEKTQIFKGPVPTKRKR